MMSSMPMIPHLCIITVNYTRSYQKGQEKGKKAARCGFFQSSRLFLHLTKHEFYITGCLNDSSFQQSKLESLNMYTSKEWSCYIARFHYTNSVFHELRLCTVVISCVYKFNVNYEHRIILIANVLII